MKTMRMKMIIGLRKFLLPVLFTQKKEGSLIMLFSGRDDFNRGDYNYNSGSFTMSDKNENHVVQDGHEDGEEEDEYGSNDEEVRFKKSA
jgi:hypothetical protein